jgi:hypothetical protein
MVSKDSILGESISIDNVQTSNLNISGYDHLNDSNCILLKINNKIVISKLENSFSNIINENSEIKVCSTKAVNDLYKNVKILESKLPENAGLLFHNSNLYELTDKDEAVSNLKLNQYLFTSNIHLRNIYLGKPDNFIDTYKLFDESYNTSSFLCKGSNDELYYEKVEYINNYESSKIDKPPSANALKEAYISLQTQIDQRLITSNVFEEIFNGDIQLRTTFSNQLYRMGIKHVAFSGNYYDLINNPTRLSAFSNDIPLMNQRCNLLDIVQKDVAMRNLGISELGITGNFEHFLSNHGNLPVILSNIAYPDFSEKIMTNGIPFLNVQKNLSDIQNKSEARFNLDLNDMATQRSDNVSIDDGNITITDIEVKSNIIIKNSNVDVILNDVNKIENKNSNIFVYLRCTDNTGNAQWDYIPEAKIKEEQIGSIERRGMTYLTNDLKLNSSNHAVTAYAISNVFCKQENIHNLIPLANENIKGIVQSSSNYLSHTNDDHIVISANGINTMYNSIDNRINGITGPISSSGTIRSIIAIESDLNDRVDEKIHNINIAANLPFIKLSIDNDSINTEKHLTLSFDAGTISGNPLTYFLNARGNFTEILPTTIQFPKLSAEFPGGNISIKGDDFSIFQEGTQQEIIFHDFTIGSTCSKIFTKEVVDVNGTNRSNMNIEFKTQIDKSVLGHTTGDNFDFIEITPSYIFNESTSTIVNLGKILTKNGWVDSSESENQVYTSIGWKPYTTVSDSTTAVNELSLTANGGDPVFKIDQLLADKPVGTGKLSIGFTGGTNNKILQSVSENAYKWGNISEILKEEYKLKFTNENPGFHDPISEGLIITSTYSNYFLNLDGKFMLTPEGKDYTNQVSWENNSTLQISQNIDFAESPQYPRIQSLLVTYSNIDKLEDFYVNKSNDCIYFEDDGKYHVQNTGVSFLETPSIADHKNKFLSYSALSNYTNTLYNDKIYTWDNESLYNENVSTNKLFTGYSVSNAIRNSIIKVPYSSTTLDNNKALSAKQTTDYIDLNCLTRTKELKFLDVAGVPLSYEEYVESGKGIQFVTGYGLSNYIRTITNKSVTYHNYLTLTDNDRILSSKQSSEWTSNYIHQAVKYTVDISDLSDSGRVFQNNNKILSAKQTSNYVKEYIHNMAHGLVNQSYTHTDQLRNNKVFSEQQTSNYIYNKIITTTPPTLNSKDNTKVFSEQQTSNYIHELIIIKGDQGNDILTQNDQVLSSKQSSIWTSNYIYNNIITTTTPLEIALHDNDKVLSASQTSNYIHELIIIKGDQGNNILTQNDQVLSSKQSSIWTSNYIHNVVKHSGTIDADNYKSPGNLFDTNNKILSAKQTSNYIEHYIHEGLVNKSYSTSPLTNDRVFSELATSDYIHNVVKYNVGIGGPGDSVFGNDNRILSAKRTLELVDLRTNTYLANKINNDNIEDTDVLNSMTTTTLSGNNIKSYIYNYILYHLHDINNGNYDANTDNNLRAPTLLQTNNMIDVKIGRVVYNDTIDNGNYDIKHYDNASVPTLLQTHNMIDVKIDRIKYTSTSSPPSIPRNFINLNTCYLFTNSLLVSFIEEVITQYYDGDIDIDDDEANDFKFPQIGGLKTWVQIEDQIIKDEYIPRICVKDAASYLFDEEFIETTTSVETKLDAYLKLENILMPTSSGVNIDTLVASVDYYNANIPNKVQTEFGFYVHKNMIHDSIIAIPTSGSIITNDYYEYKTHEIIRDRLADLISGETTALNGLLVTGKLEIKNQGTYNQGDADDPDLDGELEDEGGIKLGDHWYVAYTDDELRIKKRTTLDDSYVLKHIFR